MSENHRIDELTAQELSALVGAGVWYAKYHAKIVAERTDDRSAYAVAQREKHMDLLAGLRKLGVRIADPAAVESESRAA